MKDFFTNKLLWIPIATWFIIQLFKLIRECLKNKKLDFKRILGAGGMPSAHTACITSLATSIGISEGFGTPIFALSAVFCFIVMYDAAGVRRAAGKQARVLNKIIESDGKNINVQEKLVELLGHSPIEVMVGVIVGVLFGVFFSHIWDL
jgi:acid phosphatase family membrane protein YuiD